VLNTHGRRVRASGGPLGGAELLGAPFGARSSLRASGGPLGGRAGVFRARATARSSLRGEELWHAAFAGVRKGAVSRNRCVFAELGVSEDSSASTRNQRGTGRIGLSVREPLCFRDWTGNQRIRMESKARQIATRQNCECFRGVRGGELEKPLFPAELSKTARMRGVSLVFAVLHSLARRVKSALSQPAALRRFGGLPSVRPC
jgi:hypothetical protein